MSCLDDCPHHVLAMQASTRLSLSTTLATSLSSLLSAERYLKDFKMPGWLPLNETAVKKQIEISEKASRRSANDLQVWVNKIEQGCRGCREKENEIYQVTLQDLPEILPECQMQLDFTLQSLVQLS